MIEDNAILSSFEDAVNWASDFALDCNQSERLAYWIWANAPKPKCSLAEHKEHNPEFWDETNFFFDVKTTA
jgi:hypothetical protein